MYKVKFFSDFNNCEDIEKELNEFLKNVEPINLIHVNGWYVLLYIDKGE